MVTSSTGRSFLPFTTSSGASLSTVWKRYKNELTNLVDDTHALKDFSEHNLKRMSTCKEDFEGQMYNVRVSRQAS